MQDRRGRSQITIRRNRLGAAIRVLGCYLILAGTSSKVMSQPWTVKVKVHHIVTDLDGESGCSDEFYVRILLDPILGVGEGLTCGFLARDDGGSESGSGWECSMRIAGHDPLALINLQVWGKCREGDRHYDIHPCPMDQDAIMVFRPLTQRLLIMNMPSWEAPGQVPDSDVLMNGLHEEFGATVTFSVSAAVNTRVATTAETGAKR